MQRRYGGLDKVGEGIWQKTAESIRAAPDYRRTEREKERKRERTRALPEHFKGVHLRRTTGDKSGNVRADMDQSDALPSPGTRIRTRAREGRA